MARLPQPGGDTGAWGEILNEYLGVSLETNGSLKPLSVATQQLVNDSVIESKLSPAVRTKLNSLSTTVELRNTGTSIEWRPDPTTAWDELISIADITGPQGVKGDTGDPGIQGPKGDKGDTGDTGVQGLTGPQGTKGDTGDTGPQGTAGAQGAKGDTGDTGLTGPQGSTGPGVVSGGSTGQILSKASGTDYATQWSDITSLLPAAQTTTLTTATGDGTSTFADAFRIVKITSSAACRIRFYRSSSDRTADAARVYTTAAPTDGSLLAEFRWESPATFWTSGFTANLTQGQNTVYWRIDDGTATINIEWVRESR